jgi:hypothetical protein
VLVWVWAITYIIEEIRQVSACHRMVTIVTFS